MILKTKFKIKTILLYYRNVKKCHSSSKWVQPKGYDTNINIFNCIAQQKVPLILKNKMHATWYTCGPTVYDSAHIGHACCYVKLDIIQRILNTHFGINLVTVMNITDVDDKIIKRSSELSMESTILAWKYEKEFWEDMINLNVKQPNIVARVTNHISEIKEFINKLIDEKKAYVTEDNSVYFSLDKYDNYSKLENISTETNKYSDNNKKSTGDFALWKGIKPNEPYWETDWGKGRPGWHVECSAIASKYLGSEIDFHSGGIDLRFPHHENEEAQSCSFHNSQQWVNYWLHTGHLHLKDSVKMSKSLGNTISIKNMLDKYTADEFRIACLLSHYRHNMVFSEDMMKNAGAIFKKFKMFLNQCDVFIEKKVALAGIEWSEIEELFIETIANVDIAFKDDFDTPNSMFYMIDFISKCNKFLYRDRTKTNLNPQKYYTILAIKNFISYNLEMFGISEVKNKSTSKIEKLEDVLDVVIQFRKDIRNVASKTKNHTLFTMCDQLRSDLRSFGIELKDPKNK